MRNEIFTQIQELGGQVDNRIDEMQAHQQAFEDRTDCNQQAFEDRTDCNQQAFENRTELNMQVLGDRMDNRWQDIEDRLHVLEVQVQAAQQVAIPANVQAEVEPGNVPAVVAPGNMVAEVEPGNILREDIPDDVPAEVVPGNVPAGPAVANIVERQGFNITSPLRYDDIILGVQNATGEPNRSDAHVAGATRTRHANAWADYALASIQSDFDPWEIDNNRLQRYIQAFRAAPNSQGSARAAVRFVWGQLERLGPENRLPDHVQIAVRHIPTINALFGDMAARVAQLPLEARNEIADELGQLQGQVNAIVREVLAHREQEQHNE
ncbi:hypothetical protein GGI24_002423 [Coemansia furcata]|nr:hypothetical protein GGI24_002423 [Coemansia furcata]